MIIKNRKSTVAIVALMAAAAVVFSCITFESVIWPTDPKANTTIDINVKIKFVPETERNGHFILAFLVPKSWNVSQTVQASYSATDVQSGGKVINITDEQMLLANDYIEPTTMLPYNTAMLSKYEVLGNTGPVEWIVLRGTTYLNTVGGDAATNTVANVKISLRTGSTNIKFFTAFATCLSDNGFNTEHGGEFVISDTQIVRVTGGSGNDDFTVLKLVSTVPETFRYGDIVSIHFVSQIETTETVLKGENNVYLCAKAILDDGSEMVVEEKTDATLMEKLGDLKYRKYIYPKQFFNVPSGKNIVNMYTWFSNKDGSKVVKEGDGYEVVQSDK